MSNHNINELTNRLQNLSVQRTHAEEALDTINQEANLVEYQLRVARAAGRQDRATTTNTEAATTTVVNRNKNNFRIGDIVRITNKYRVHEQGAEGTVTSVTSAYVNLRNATSGATYRRHWRNLLLITATTQ